MTVVKREKLPVTRLVSSEVVIYNIMYNNTILYVWKLLRVGAKISHNKQKNVTMWGDDAN